MSSFPHHAPVALRRTPRRLCCGAPLPSCASLTTSKDCPQDSSVIGGPVASSKARSQKYGKTLMDMSHQQQKPPDAINPAECNELVNRIRKLRWMGLEDEAAQLQSELTRRQAAASDSVVAMSGETD
ncbi:MAG: hypothetical protein WCA56_10590 [Xanthobacteraceae bacterium]